MSLKAFHIIFVIVSTLLMAGLAVWGFRRYFSPEGSPVDLAWGIGSSVATIALLVYGRYFLKKLKKISYL